MSKPRAETIFFMHRDGTMLSFHSRIPVDDQDEKLFENMAEAIREQMNKVYVEGEHVHKLHFEGHNIMLEDSTHLYAAVVIGGEEQPLMYMETLRFLELIEHKHAEELDNWTGDKSVVKDLDRYSDALFMAMDKISDHSPE